MKTKTGTKELPLLGVAVAAMLLALTPLAGGGRVGSVGGTAGSVGTGGGGVMLSVGGVVSIGSGGLGGGVSSGFGPQAVIRPALSSARPRPIVSR